MTDPTPESGRELDAVVAEEVFGWRLRWSVDTPLAHEAQEYDPGMPVPSGPTPAPIPLFSTDIAAAWELFKKVPVETIIRTHDGWEVTVWPRGLHTYVRATAETAPEAICRAALKAVRADTEGADG